MINNKKWKEVSNEIRKVMKNRGISLSKLSKDIGKQQAVISRTMNAKCTPNYDIVAKICDYLEIKIDLKH